MKALARTEIHEQSTNSHSKEKRDNSISQNPLGDCNTKDAANLTVFIFSNLSSRITGAKTPLDVSLLLNSNH